MHWLATFFQGLRSRPRHERVILAGITYGTLALAVIAIWFTSLEAMLHFGPASPRPSAELGITSRPNAEITSRALATPLESLQDAIRDFRSNLSDFKTLFRGAAEQPSEPPSPPNSPVVSEVEPPVVNEVEPPGFELEFSRWLDRLGRVVGYNLETLREGLAAFLRYWTE